MHSAYLAEAKLLIVDKLSHRAGSILLLILGVIGSMIVLNNTGHILGIL